MPHVFLSTEKDYFALHYAVLHCTALHFIMLKFTSLHCITLHFTVLQCHYCTVLHCNMLQCTVLHCTSLHCTVVRGEEEISISKRHRTRSGKTRHCTVSCFTTLKYIERAL